MQDVNLSQALTVTIVSMLVVFLVLILISYSIGVLKSLGKSKDKKGMMDSSTTTEVQEVDEDIEDSVNLTVEDGNEEELVAVIASVIAENLGRNVSDINIQKIRRIDKSVWNDTARMEQMN